MTRPRIRQMHPQWVTSRDLRRLTSQGLTVWWALISQADDEGRLHADVEDVVSLVSVWCRKATVLRSIDAMARQKMVHLYEKDGEPYIQIINFPKYQYVPKPRPSEFPPPDDLPNGSRIDTEQVSNPSVTDTERVRPSRARGRIGKDREGKGREGKDRVGMEEHETNVSRSSRARENRAGGWVENFLQSGDLPGGEAC